MKHFVEKAHLENLFNLSNATQIVRKTKAQYGTITKSSIIVSISIPSFYTPSLLLNRTKLLCNSKRRI